MIFVCALDILITGGFFLMAFLEKNASKYTKLMVEQYVCDNVNHTFRVFSF